MRARDVMSPGVVTVAPETPVQRIAQLLLEHGISAVPVVEHGAPVGLISESDLIVRRRPPSLGGKAWMLRLIGRVHHEVGDRGGPEPGGLARDVMSTPVVTAEEHEDADRIVELMARHAIKRVLIVRSGRLVGLVSRTDLLRRLAHEPPDRKSPLRHDSAPPGQSAAAAGEPRATDTDGLGLSAIDFRSLVERHDHQLHEKIAAERRAAAAQRVRDIDAAIAARLTEDAWRRLLIDARKAAERGEAECLLLRVPREVMSDGGRSIIAGEPGWQATLRGESADIRDRWQVELSARGFRLTARVLDYADSIPAHIGLFLVWGR